MKAKIISILSVLSAIAIFIFAVIQASKSHHGAALSAVFSLLIPAYFLFAVLVQHKYGSIGKSPEKNNTKKKNQKDTDFGKVLEFPSDRKK